MEAIIISPLHSCRSSHNDYLSNNVGNRIEKFHQIKFRFPFVPESIGTFGGKLSLRIVVDFTLHESRCFLSTCPFSFATFPSPIANTSWSMDRFVGNRCSNFSAKPWKNLHGCSLHFLLDHYGACGFKARRLSPLNKFEWKARAVLLNEMELASSHYLLK